MSIFIFHSRDHWNVIMILLHQSLIWGRGTDEWKEKLGFMEIIIGELKYVEILWILKQTNFFKSEVLTNSRIFLNYLTNDKRIWKSLNYND